MNADFEKYTVPELHSLEGGKVDDPDDPGGRTNMGVTQRTYNAYRRNKGLSIRDVYTITEDEWAEIMKKSFWDKVHGDDAPVGVDYVLCDAAVNSGPERSIKFLQGALGIPADGMYGEETAAALAANVDNDILIAKMIDLRFAFCRELHTWKKYKNGWTARFNHVKTKGQALATGSVGPTAVYFAGGDHKALVEDAAPLPPKSLGDATGVGGVATAGMTQVQSALSPLSDMAIIGRALAVIAAIGAVVGAAGFVYSYYARKREAARNKAFQVQPPSTQVSTTSTQPGVIPPTPPAPPLPSPPAAQNLVLPAETGYVGVVGVKV